MEIFDIVDEHGQPTGETVERTVAHTKGIRHRTAHIWVIREENGRTEVLLQKRSDDKDSFPGRYDTSSSGHIHAGDEPLISAVRELSEEIGIFAEPEDLEFAGTFDIKYAKEFYGKLFCDNEVSYVYIYKKPVDISTLTLQTEEVSEVRWFDLEDAYKRILAHDPELCVPIGGIETMMRYINFTV